MDNCPFIKSFSFLDETSSKLRKSNFPFILGKRRSSAIVCYVIDWMKKLKLDSKCVTEQGWAINNYFHICFEVSTPANLDIAPAKSLPANCARHRQGGSENRYIYDPWQNSFSLHADRCNYWSAITYIDRKLPSKTYFEWLTSRLAIRTVSFSCFLWPQWFKYLMQYFYWKLLSLLD